jgi:hypothetical protein
MKTQHIEMARQAAALLRDVLTGEDPARFVSTNSALGEQEDRQAVCGLVQSQCIRTTSHPRQLL